MWVVIDIEGEIQISHVIVDYVNYQMCKTGLPVNDIFPLTWVSPFGVARLQLIEPEKSSEALAAIKLLVSTYIDK